MKYLLFFIPFFLAATESSDSSSSNPNDPESAIGREKKPESLVAVDYNYPDSRVSKEVDYLIHSKWYMQGVKVSFTVANGVVTLTGNVQTADQKAQIGNNVKALRGVKGVVNNIQVP